MEPDYPTPGEVRQIQYALRYFNKSGRNEEKNALCLVSITMKERVVQQESRHVSTPRH